MVAKVAQGRQSVVTERLFTHCLMIADVLVNVPVCVSLCPFNHVNRFSTKCTMDEFGNKPVSASVKKHNLADEKDYHLV